MLAFTGVHQMYNYERLRRCGSILPPIFVLAVIFYSAPVHAFAVCFIGAMFLFGKQLVHLARCLKGGLRLVAATGIWLALSACGVAAARRSRPRTRSSSGRRPCRGAPQVARREPSRPTDPRPAGQEPGWLESGGSGSVSISPEGPRPLPGPARLAGRHRRRDGSRPAR